MRQWRRPVTQSALVDVPNSMRQRWDLLLECGHRVNRDYGGGSGPRSVDCEVCADKARPWLRPDNGQPYGHIRTMSEPFGNNVWCGAVEAGRVAVATGLGVWRLSCGVGDRPRRPELDKSR
jgi:hypothetical protein